VHPSVEMVHKWIEELPAKSGRSLEQWARLGEKRGAQDRPRPARLAQVETRPRDQCGVVDRRPRRRQGCGRLRPRIVSPRGGKLRRSDVQRAEGGAQTDSRSPARHWLSLGDDVKICPCKTIVPLYRNHVFAQVKPTTRTRIDFGLALRDTMAQGRLIDTGGFAKKIGSPTGSPVSSLEEIDAEGDAMVT